MLSFFLCVVGVVRYKIDTGVGIIFEIALLTHPVLNYEGRKFKIDRFN